ncbi:MAG: SPOR domain-containing protein [Aquisalimonadaceae bacterium]
MRLLFAALLLFNLLLFAWFMVNRSDVADQPPRPGPGSLALLEQPRSWDGPCFQSQRLIREADADTIAARYGARARIMAEEDRRSIGYWVYLPPRSSLEDARRDMSRLQEAGVSDVALVSESGMSNAVSLGVYGSRERAERRRIFIENLGFPARAEQRFRSQTLYRVILEAEESPDHSGVDWEQTDCQPDGV